MTDATAATAASDPLTADGAAADALTERLFSAAVASFDLAGVYLGDRLGWYASLDADGPATPEELAGRTGSDARYAREWLEQQATSAILAVDDDGRFRLPAGHRPVLVDPTSLNHIAPLARRMAAAIGQLPALVTAYRSGAGIGWEAYGDDMREGQAGMNRPAFTHQLGREWLPAIEDVHTRLQADPPARVLDVACGEGWSTIALAGAYPNARVLGVDLDAPSIEAARRHAAEAGIGTDRLEFRHADAADLAGPFDAALIVEAVHDMSDPVSVLAAVRGALGDDASLIVVDEKGAERFEPPGDDLERFMYGWSITTCLPDGRSRTPSVATGTVMRPDTLRRYAAEAGYRELEVLGVESDFFRFYRLRP